MCISYLKIEKTHAHLKSKVFSRRDVKETRQDKVPRGAKVNSKGNDIV